jgi:quercetin dioxygenase-like cupin family protein
MSFIGTRHPLILNRGEGVHLDVLGEKLTLLVSGQQTHGAFAVISVTSPPGGGTPLHQHHDEDEAFYVLEGEYAIRCGARTVRAGPGSFVFAPRGVPHKLTNVSAEPSTHLGIVSPAGFERFFEEMSQLPKPPAVERIMEVAAKYRLEILAP